MRIKKKKKQEFMAAKRVKFAGTTSKPIWLKIPRLCVNTIEKFRFKYIFISVE